MNKTINFVDNNLLLIVNLQHTCASFCIEINVSVKFSFIYWILSSLGIDGFYKVISNMQAS